MSRCQLHQLSTQQQLHIVIESYESGLYQAFISSAEPHTGKTQEQLIWRDPHTPLKAHSLTDLRAQLQHLSLASLHLRQNSAFDEMIGQPHKHTNTLLVPLSTSAPPGA